MNPATGAQTLVSSGGNFSFPIAIAETLSGDLIVADSACCGGTGGLIRVNSTTGAQQVLARGGNFSTPMGIVLASNGDPIVLNGGCPQSADLVVRVNPTTGAQTVIARGDHLNCPSDIAVGLGDDLFVTVGPAQTRPACPSGSLLGVVQVSPSTGAQKIISSGGQFSGPGGLAVAPGGQLFIADSNTCCGVPGSVFRVDPVTGEQTVVATGGNFNQPMGITFVQPPALPALVPGTGCAAPGAVCRAELILRRQAGADSPVGTVVVAGSIETGPCPPTGARSCLVFETRDSFTVSGSIDGLGPGYVPALRIPTASADGTALGMRELPCEPADASGQAHCRVALQEAGVFPRHGDTVRVRAACPVSVEAKAPCQQPAHP
ncbi:MAG: hypothetical protein ACREKS_06560 [Candidatus Rokuibacteriota bacterium]